MISELNRQQFQPFSDEVYEKLEDKSEISPESDEKIEEFEHFEESELRYWTVVLLLLLGTFLVIIDYELTMHDE